MWIYKLVVIWLVFKNIYIYMKIIKDDLEIRVETPLTKLREDLSEHFIDFSSIKYLQGNKKLLVQAFREVLNESITN